MKTRFETGKAYGEHPCVFRITGRDADSVECDYHGKKLHLGIFDLDGNEAVRYGRICTTAQRVVGWNTPILFEATAEDVHRIADRLNNSLISEIPEKYHRQYGAGWMLKLQGDIVATAVEWCHRDYTAGGYRPTADEIVRAYYDYSYYDLFEEMGLSKLRPPSALESGLVSTYAHAMAEE